MSTGGFKEQLQELAVGLDAVLEENEALRAENESLRAASSADLSDENDRLRRDLQTVRLILRRFALIYDGLADHRKGQLGDTAPVLVAYLRDAAFAQADDEEASR